MTDQVEVLRLAARDPGQLAEVALLIRTLSEEELDRLADLLAGWEGWPGDIPRERSGGAWIASYDAAEFGESGEGPGAQVAG